MRYGIVFFVLFITVGSLQAKPPKENLSIIERMGTWAIRHFATKRFPQVVRLSQQAKEHYLDSSSRATSMIILYEFATGTGPNSRYFYPNQPYTQEFIKGPGLAKVLRLYFSNYAELSGTDTILEPADDIRYQFSPRVGTFEPETWLPAIGQNILTLYEDNMAQFILGSFNASIYPTTDGKRLNIHIWNRMSRRSFFAGFIPRVQRPMYFGTTYQHIVFTLSVDEAFQLLRKPIP